MPTYDEVLDDVNFLARKGIETGAIGDSRHGRMIPYVHIRGKDEGARVLVTAGIHAREEAGVQICLRQIYEFASKPPACDLWFVPMCNPDGNVLVHYGAAAFGVYGKTLLSYNGENPDFSLWKANAAGVDLNVNFDAEWGTGTQNIRTPSRENYIGPRPTSEPETAALVRFTRRVRPMLTLSYHAKGREIYCDFYASGKLQSICRAAANEAARLTGYRVAEGERGSAGGYKDWCISALHTPALTIEFCDDALSHPIPDSVADAEFAIAPRLPDDLGKFLRTM